MRTERGTGEQKKTKRVVIVDKLRSGTKGMPGMFARASQGMIF